MRDLPHVDIWSVELTAPERCVLKSLSWLSPEELDRAARFKFDEHRRQFIISHGVLRALLSSLSGIDPAAIEFTYGANGKPRLKDAIGSIFFNMSHSEGLAVYALTHGCEVGIDVETVRSITDIENIAAQFFNP